MNEHLKRCDTCGDETPTWKEVGDLVVCADCYIAYTISAAVSDATAVANARIAELERQLVAKGSVVRRPQPHLDAILQAERSGDSLWA